jgi:hypothetical protein
VGAITGGFSGIDVLTGGGTVTNTLTGLASGTWSSAGLNAGTYASSGNTLTFSNFGNWLGGAGADTFNGANISGTLNDGGGATSLSGAITSGGTQTYSGAVTLTGNTTTSGSAISFGSTVNGGSSLTANSGGTTTFSGAIGGATALANLTTDAPGLSILGGNVTVTGSINLLDVTTANGATMTSTGSGAITVNNADATSPAFISTSGSVTLGGTLIGSALDPLDLSVTPGALTMTQQVIAFFAGPAIPATVVFPAGSSITYNGAVIAQSILQQQASAASSQVAATVSAAVTEEANKTFGTDSVAEDVEYGFAGEVGTTPPMDHRIDEAGISLPQCVEEAREGEPCK